LCVVPPARRSASAGSAKLRLAGDRFWPGRRQLWSSANYKDLDSELYLGSLHSCIWLTVPKAAVLASRGGHNVIGSVIKQVSSARGA